MSEASNEDSDKVRILSSLSEGQTLAGQMKTAAKAASRQNILAVVKNILASPFFLKWPSISPEHEKQICDSIVKAFDGLKRIKPVISYPRGIKLKGKDLREFRKKCKQDELRRMSCCEDLVKRCKIQSEARSHFVTGYNAVMRNLEKGNLCAVLVLKDAGSVFLTKAFIPCCAKNGARLLPVRGLGDLLKNDTLLGVSCLALGLKNSVKNKASRFYELYSKIFEVLDADSTILCKTIDSEGGFMALAAGLDKKVQTNSSLGKPHSTCDMSGIVDSIYLKRKSKTERIFTPRSNHSIEQSSSAFGTDSEFIPISDEGCNRLDSNGGNTCTKHFASNDANKLTSSVNIENDLKLRYFKTIKERKHSEIRSMNLCRMSSEDLFVLDAENEQGDPEHVDEKLRCREKKNIFIDSYVPATVKRMKSNPNHKREKEALKKKQKTKQL